MEGRGRLTDRQADRQIKRQKEKETGRNKERQGHRNTEKHRESYETKTGHKGKLN